MASERNNASGGEGRLNVAQNLWRAALVLVRIGRSQDDRTVAVLDGSYHGIVTLIVLGRKGPHGFPFRRPHSHFPIH